MRGAPQIFAVLLFASACARPYAPPGGERDELPPRLVATDPAALAVVPAGTQPVVFRFDERLSERNFSEALITVSPLDGALRVDRRRNEVRVRIDGGWRADRVYRVVLLPGARDLFGNTRTDAAEIVFSTGPPVPATTLFGIVLDRITERAAQRPVVTAVRRGDGVTYMAVADTSGFYALRHLPYGTYDVRAFADGNNNRRRDSLEPVDSGRVATLSAGADTQMVMFHVLAPDSTPPDVRSATVIDSVQVRVTMSDYLDEATAFAGATAEVIVLPDSARYALGSLTLGQPQAQARRGVVPTDTAAAVDSARRQLPSQEIIVRLNRALQPGTYRILLRDITNISGVRGGGSARFEVRERPGAVRRDTAVVRRDTARARRVR